jgi:hypothetical protein
MERTSFECTKAWGSVRKIRYLVDVKSAADYIWEYRDKEFDSNILRDFILLGRQKRLELIHKHFQSVLYMPLGRSSLQTEKLRITMPDTLTFLKNIGILHLRNGCVSLSPLAEQLREILVNDNARLLLIEALIGSKYSAYWCLLVLLQTRTTVEIPKALARRGVNLGKELRRQGVYTDVPSFYTLRDLFYELEAVNWCMDSEGNERIYSVIEITQDETKRRDWQYSFRIGDLILLYRRKIDINLFVTTLVDSYLELTSERFDVETSLISVRDSVCSRLKISDQQFKELIEEARKVSKNVVIRLSYGSMYGKKRNYGLKITTLPNITSERLAMYIRLKRSEPLG